MPQPLYYQNDSIGMLVAYIPPCAGTSLTNRRTTMKQTLLILIATLYLTMPIIPYPN